MVATVAAQRSLTGWDLTLMGLLLGSVVLMFYYETVDDPQQRRMLEWIDLGLVVLFIAEWLWRLTREPSGRRGRFAARHSWELLGMVPLMAPVPGALRLLRLVRLIRILRVVGVIGAYLGTWERIAKDSSLGKIGIAAGSITLVGAVLVWLIEREDNPGLSHFPDALWWAIVTVTTVGYGDITPQEPTARVVAGLLMLAGIGTIGLLASSLASVLVARDVDASAAPPAMAGVLTQELTALAGLHDAGKLTDDEFGRAKERLLR